MASVVKSVSGNATTFTVTDSGGAAATVVVTSGAVTGNTVTFGGAAVHNDAVAMIFDLLNQIQTSVIPGAGAQNLNP